MGRSLGDVFHGQLVTLGIGQCLGSVDHRQRWSLVNKRIRNIGAGCFRSDGGAGAITPVKILGAGALVAMITQEPSSLTGFARRTDRASNSPLLPQAAAAGASTSAHNSLGGGVPAAKVIRGRYEGASALHLLCTCFTRMVADENGRTSGLVPRLHAARSVREAYTWFAPLCAGGGEGRRAIPASGLRTLRASCALHTTRTTDCDYPE